MSGKNDGESDEALSAESEHSSHDEHESSTDDEESDDSLHSLDSLDSLDSEMDMAELDRRRAETLAVMANLECQYKILREQYYVERIKQIDQKLAALRDGTSEEHLPPINELEKVFHNGVEVEDIQGAQKNFESEKKLTYDQIYDDLMVKKRRLEEDHLNKDISLADFTDKRTSKVRSPRRKKAVTRLDGNS